MQRYNGFSFIEMLVVVLIVAILSAIAYPYYQTALWRSRVVKLMPLGRHLAQQVALYYAENGKWPNTYEIAVFVPNSFKLEEQETENGVDVGWQDKEVKVYCVRGNDSTGDLANCRTIALAVREENWGDSMTLLFNAQVDDTVSANWSDRYEIICLASTLITGPEYELTHKLCRSLVGEPIREGSFVYVTK